MINADACPKPDFAEYFDARGQGYTSRVYGIKNRYVAVAVAKDGFVFT